MNIESLFNTVLKNSEDTTRAIETTKMAILEQVKTGDRVAAALEKNAETNRQQTEAINSFMSHKQAWESERKALLDEFKEERKKLMKWIMILLALLFIGVGGFSLLQKLHSLGLLGGVL